MKNLFKGKSKPDVQQHSTLEQIAEGDDFAATLEAPGAGKPSADEAKVTKPVTVDAPPKSTIALPADHIGNEARSKSYGANTVGSSKAAANSEADEPKKRTLLSFLPGFVY